MGLFSSRKAALGPEVAKMAEAYRRKYGHEPSKRTLWLMGQQAAAMTRRPKSEARKIHGGGGDAGEAERLAAWEAQTAAREITALSRVHRDVAAFGSRPVRRDRRGHEGDGGAGRGGGGAGASRGVVAV